MEMDLSNIDFSRIIEITKQETPEEWAQKCWDIISELTYYSLDYFSHKQSKELIKSDTQRNRRIKELGTKYDELTKNVPANVPLDVYEEITKEYDLNSIDELRRAAT